MKVDPVILEEINEIVREQFGEDYEVAYISNPRPPKMCEALIVEVGMKYHEEDMHKKTKSFQKHNKKFLRGGR